MIPDRMSGNPKAFSLVETLVVIAIMGIVAALTLPAISSTLNGIKLSDAGQTIANEIHTGRATALALNLPVEVWFLKEGDRFNAVRTLVINPDNQASWVSRARRLPSGLGIAEHGNLSNLIAMQTPETPPQTPSTIKGVSLRIFPSGRAEPGNAPSFDASDPLFLTVVPTARFDLQNDSAPPSNFATVQIEPANSRVTTHRP